MDLKKIVTKLRLQFTLNLIAATIVASLASAKAYADGLKAALVAGDIAFTNAAFNGGNKTDVGSALVELATAQSNGAVTFEVLSNPNTGKLKSYRFTKGTGAGATTMDIDIEKDLLNGTFELVTIVAGTGDNAGKFYDGQTEVGSSVGVTKAGVFMKYNSNAASDSPAYSYADMTGLVEYLTVGTQTGKVVTLSIDSATHTITADIADGAIGKAKLSTEVQNILDAAPQKISADPMNLTAEQLESLNVGDQVIKTTGNQKHIYTVTYKDATAHEIALVYDDVHNVEEIYYEQDGNGNWKSALKENVNLDSALHPADFDEITENECSAAWTAAMAAAEAAE